MLFILLTAGTFLSSCGASLTTVTMERRLPPKHPVEFSKKSIAVFSTIGNLEDSIVNIQISKALSESLEKRLSLRKGSVPVYNHFPEDSARYTSDYIRELSLLADSDLLFILNGVWANEPVILQNSNGDERFGQTYAIMTVNTEIVVYDGITAKELASVVSKDTLVISRFVSRNDLRKSVLLSLFYQSLVDSAGEIGESVADNFFEKWEPIERYIYYFNNSDWQNALAFAQSFRWSEAAKIWMEKSSSEDALVAACAAYNMALVCEVSGEKALAAEWLNFARKKYPLKPIEGYRNYLLR